MTLGRGLVLVFSLALVAVLAIATAILLPNYLASSPEPAATAGPPPPPATPKIKARLFYVSDDGLGLVPVEREVEFGQGVAAQARQIVDAQIERPEAPLVSAIPEGTRVRAIFVDERGQAFVDLSAQVSTGHPGGALEESLTVYSIVNAVTANLPAVKAVQILVEGREVDTLAGHVDLRRPLPAGPAWVQEPAAAPAAPETTGAPAAEPAAPPAGAPRGTPPIKH